VPYLTIDTHSPVLVARRVGVADAPSVTSMLRWVGEHLAASDRKLSFVYDAGETPGGLPDAPARRAGGEWLGRNQTLLREKCAGLDFAFVSPVSRGALTAVFWIAHPPIPWAIHASLALAIEASLARLGEPPERAIEIARELGRRPSR